MVDIVPENLYFSPQTPEDTSQQNRISKDILRLADQLALQGQYTEAFKNYSKAFKLCSSFPPAVLECLAEALCRSHSNRIILAHMSSEESKLFRCYLCKAVLFKPTTLSCGHTFCHKCLQNNETWACRLCGVTDYILDRKNCPPTTLLLNLVEKVFPKHCQAERLRQKGKKCMQKREYLQAIKLFTQALEEAPSSHLVLSNRSLAYSHLEQFNLALKDAERVIEMQPTWPKGYYRKGCILSEMHNSEAAVTALLDCLAINPYWSKPKEKLLLALHQVLSEDVKREEQLCSSSLSHSLTKKAQMACLPQTECAPNSGETSERETRMSPSSSWYHSPKLPYSRTLDYAQDKAGRRERAKEYQAEAAADYGAAAAAFEYDEISEKSVSDCDELEEEEYFNFQSCRDKKRNSLPTQFDGKSLIDSMPAHAASEPSLFQPVHKKEKDEQEQSNPVQENFSPSWTSRSEQSQCEEFSLCAASCCQPQLPLLKQDDLQCSLCLFLLYEPLVTPCGHAFCRECLVRSLDHSPQCPLCKQSLTAYLAAHKWAVSESLENIIKSFFPVELARRKKIHEEEMSRLAQVEDNCEIPMFVCTFACPTIRCPLHIFEPRYRLMIRRCLECGSKQFGMTTATSMSGDYAEYGCMLKIKHVQTLDDGRSLLDTVGDKRFKVLERGTKDGYNIARVSFLKDDPIERSERTDLINLEREVYMMCKQWLDFLHPESLRKISDHYGPLPIPQEAELDQPNGPSWVWWMITILPIDNKLQVTAMSFTKLSKRLQFIKSAILTIQSKLSS